MLKRYFEINENGHNIRCKLYARELHDIHRVVIFCHGFGGHKDNAAAEKFAERMLSKQKGAAMITFNWPCHGDDVKKKLCLADCNAYLELVLSYARRQYQTEELYAYATSFGGYLTLKYIAEHGNPFRKIALRCPAVNMYDLLTKVIMTEEELAKLRERNDVKWTFISPAADFQADGERTGKYLLAGEQFTLNSRNESIISYADYAIATVDEIESGKHIQQRISVVRA